MTDLDTAHAAMEAAPDDDAARLKFFERLADTALFLLLESEADGDQVTPEIFDVEGEKYVLVFDREERLSKFVGRVAPYAGMPGRALAQMLDGQGIGLALNPEVAPSAMLVPATAITWLADTLRHAPTQTEARLTGLSAPNVPEAVVIGLDRKLATAAGRARSAYLAAASYEGGGQGHVLAFMDAQDGAEQALANAANEALTFSGIAAGMIDVMFVQASDPLSAHLARVGLRFDLPEPEQPQILRRPRHRPGKTAKAALAAKAARHKRRCRRVRNQPAARAPALLAFPARRYAVAMVEKELPPVIENPPVDHIKAVDAPACAPQSAGRYHAIFAGAGRRLGMRKHMVPVARHPRRVRAKPPAARKRLEPKGRGDRRIIDAAPLAGHDKLIHIADQHRAGAGQKPVPRKVQAGRLVELRPAAALGKVHLRPVAMRRIQHIRHRQTGQTGNRRAQRRTVISGAAIVQDQHRISAMIALMGGDPVANPAQIIIPDLGQQHIAARKPVRLRGIHRCADCQAIAGNRQPLWCAGRGQGQQIEFAKPAQLWGHRRGVQRKISRHYPALKIQQLGRENPHLPIQPNAIIKQGVGVVSLPKGRRLGPRLARQAPRAKRLWRRQAGHIVQVRQHRR